MREILFRGKCQTGEWVEGGYHKHCTRMLCPLGNDSLKDNEIRHLIIRDGFADWNMPRGIEAVEVDPKTVGQFTGLLDKNGKKIFEGDILLTNGMDGKLLWVSYFDDETAQFDFYPLGHEYCSTHNKLYYSSKRQIIGNIHDNPELLT